MYIVNEWHGMTRKDMTMTKQNEKFTEMFDRGFDSLMRLYENLQYANVTFGESSEEAIIAWSNFKAAAHIFGEIFNMNEYEHIVKIMIEYEDGLERFV